MSTPERLAKIEAVLRKRQPDLTIVLENVHDPHNVSAVLRSCDAVGILSVYLLYHSGQKFPELGEKSSASARKWVDCRKFSTVAECYADLRSKGFRILATSLTADSVDLYSVDFTKPVAVVFGNERDGISEDALKLSDGNIRIPQVGMIQSLNISVACAVTAFEAFRQRSAAGFYDKVRFNSDDFEVLMQDWLQR